MLLRRLALVLRVSAYVLTGLLVLLLAFGVYLFKVSETLPDVGTEPADLVRARTSVVYAADGSVIAKWHGEQDRTYVDLDLMPTSLRDAV
ncbi:MAG: hypothetical protein JXP72_08830, partial [Coriobacteriia bacterium]|nr:hypothetical protein [Coriobacteriia bacterium]